MKKKYGKITSIALALTLSSTLVANADSNKKIVMWGKTELKLGQIGKVTILDDTNLVSINEDGSLTGQRTLKRGEEYRVYQYNDKYDGLYGVGSSSYILKDDRVKYETPSKDKLSQLSGYVESRPSGIGSTKLGSDGLSEFYSDTLSDKTKNYALDNAKSTFLFSSGMNVTFKDNYKSVSFMVLEDTGKWNIIYTPNKTNADLEFAKYTSLLLKDLGYKVSEKTLSSIVKKSLTTKLPDEKVTEDLYVKRFDNALMIYQK